MQLFEDEPGIAVKDTLLVRILTVTQLVTSQYALFKCCNITPAVKPVEDGSVIMRCQVKCLESKPVTLLFRYYSFTAPALISEIPPISIFSIISWSEAPEATVSSKG
jgi:hypothetical protein